MGDEHNVALCMKYNVPSREAGELRALYWVAKNILHLIGSSKSMMENLSKNLKSNKMKGYIGMENRNLYIAAVVVLRTRTAKTTLQIKGGARVMKDTKKAKKLVVEAATQNTDIFDKPHLSIDLKFNLIGAQLSSLMQENMYQ